MKRVFIISLMLALTACGSKEQQLTLKGQPGQDGVSMGIDVSSVAPTCLAGGSTIRTFVDANRDGSLAQDETVKQIAVVCNGINGTNGLDGVDGTSATVATATVAQCPTGGIAVTSGMLSYQICNGADGAMGPTGQAGINGLDGAQGPAGVDGKSAFELWLASGNQGDENDFLASLKGLDGLNGSNGLNGADGLSAYQVWLSLGNTGTESDFVASLTGPAGQNGSNGNNGSNGSNGSTGATGKSAFQVWLDLGNTGTEAQFIASLKGATGSAGTTGPQGPQGVSGGVGNMTPVQLCPGDSGSFKEMGFIVGQDLYAVYFDKNQPIAFLAKLNPGSYVTTNGANCYFNYANNGSTITLMNSNNSNLVTTVSLTTGSTPGGSLAGSCSVSKFNDFNSEQQFHFFVTGMASYTGYTLEVTFTNGSTVNQVQDSNGGSSNYANPKWTIAPQNSSTGFDFYAKHNGNVVNKPAVSSAVVSKGGQTMNCTVSN